MEQLQGKVVLITGAAKGIGFYLAKELLRNKVKGLAIVDLDDESSKLALENLTNEYPTQSIIYIPTDVAQRSQFEEAFEQTVRTFNQLDIVINNAGIIHEMAWEKCIAVNLQGCITGSLLALDKYFPKTLGHSEGIILNIASVAGLSPMNILPVYSATKHGVIGFSRSISDPFRCFGLNVRVLVLCPGSTITDILHITTDQISQKFWEGTNKVFHTAPKQRPEELAQHAVSIMKEGKSGSVWIVDKNIAKEVTFPASFSAVKELNA